MKVEKRIVLTQEEKNMLVYLRDKFGCLLKDEGEFNGRTETDGLYVALWNFCDECF